MVSIWLGVLYWFVRFRNCLIKAMAPATIGVAIEVPPRISYVPSLFVEFICEPGARSLTSEFLFAWQTIWSSAVDESVHTVGLPQETGPKLASYVFATCVALEKHAGAEMCVVFASFPVAMTIEMFLLYAASTAVFQSASPGSLSQFVSNCGVVPRLIDMTVMLYVSELSVHQSMEFVKSLPEFVGCPSPLLFSIFTPISFVLGAIPVIPLDAAAIPATCVPCPLSSSTEQFCVQVFP